MLLILVSYTGRPAVENGLSKSVPEGSSDVGTSAIARTWLIPSRTMPKVAYPPSSRFSGSKPCASVSAMYHCESAESSSVPRAIPMAPSTWLRFSLCSSGMVSPVPPLPHCAGKPGTYTPFDLHSGSPDCVTKSLITRWKKIPS